MKLALTEGAYEARSVIAGAQRCINLYAEKNPDDSPFPFTFYPTPGLKLVATAPNAPAEIRGAYAASNGSQFVVSGANVYTVSASWTWTFIGSISSTAGPVWMVDNTITLLIVDGSPLGWTVDLGTNAFTAITDVNWLGANRVGYVDTYFVTNQPLTNNWYISNSLSASWNALNFAQKTGYNDNLQAIAVMHREVWIFGSLTTEIWYNAGSAGFAYAELPGTFIQQGCAAPNSVAQFDLSLFWLGQNPSGNRIVFKGEGYRAKRISTHAIEAALDSYTTVNDARAFCYMQEGHTFYVLTFPTANATWVYDLSTNLWHQRMWSDPAVGGGGEYNRWRANCQAVFNGANVVGDYANGKLYQLDLATYLDDGNPIVRIRSWPQIVNENKRVMYRMFMADIETGQPLTGSNSDTATVSLRWSDDRGRSWSNAMTQSLGLVGQTRTAVNWNRLGMARGRVFELSWSAPMRTALNGAYIEAIEANS